MEVIVNNISESLVEGSSLEVLLIKQDLKSQKGIAVAVNNEVISKSEWSKTMLFSKDKITVIKATQGG